MSRQRPGLGVDRDAGVGQLTDVFVGSVVEAVRPHRVDGHGEGWRLLASHHEVIGGWVAEDLTAVKVHELLGRRGVVVPWRTVQRYVLRVCGRGRGRGPTVRIVDGEPGDELQVDFGRMGFIVEGGRRRVVQALIFTACYSRHCFVWLSLQQTTQAVIVGLSHEEGRRARPHRPAVEARPRRVRRALAADRRCVSRRLARSDRADGPSVDVRLVRPEHPQPRDRSHRRDEAPAAGRRNAERSLCAPAPVRPSSPVGYRPRLLARGRRACAPPPLGVSDAGRHRGAATPRVRRGVSHHEGHVGLAPSTPGKQPSFEHVAAGARSPHGELRPHDPASSVPRCGALGPARSQPRRRC